MKTIKVQFVGFWPGFKLEEFCVYKALQKYYNVELSEDPDYIICSIFSRHTYVDFPQVRIFFSGENFAPDFNLVDYAISVYPLDFLDRHFSFPGMVDRMDHYLELQGKNRDYPASVLQEKQYFANSISSHDSDNSARSELVKLLSKYKRVECPGKLLYNMPNGETVKREDGSKRALQNKCKFTLCLESTCEGGFITEKIFEAFCADTIPIYYGSSDISDIFNKDAFIDIAEYADLQSVVERIIELDQDDEEYLKMLRQPIFVHSEYIEEKIADFERFLCHIFDQPLEQAQRRPRNYTPKEYEKIVRCGISKYQEERLQDKKKQKRIELHMAVKNGIYNVICAVIGKKNVVRLIREIKRKETDT